MYITVFPHILLRVGGDTFDQFNRLESISLKNSLKEILYLNEEMLKLKLILCENLFSHIKKQKNSRHQNVLQNFRRNLYNGRPIKNREIESVFTLLSKKLKNSIEEYFDKTQTYKNLIIESEHTYTKEIGLVRQNFKRLLESEIFKQGLVLSSQSLLERLSKYQVSNVVDFGKKELQTELGALKYITRIYTKTTPFSTFTSLALGELQENTQSAVSLEKVSLLAKETTSHIRLNNLLFRYLWDLFRSYKTLFLRFPVRINPTISVCEDHYLFLINSNNVESFQRINKNEFIDLAWQILSKRSGGLIFKSLIQRVQHSVDASSQELEQYINKLVNYGFLEYNLGVSGIDPDWDLSLIGRLKYLAPNVPYVKELMHALTFIRTLANRFGSSQVEERKIILKQAYASFKDAYLNIHKAAGLPKEEREEQMTIVARHQRPLSKNFKNQDKPNLKSNGDSYMEFSHKNNSKFHLLPEQMFYEDSVRHIKAILDKKLITQLIEKLHNLLQELKLFQGNQDEKKKMTSYFLYKYGSDESVDLLTFYENYYKEFKKQESIEFSNNQGEGNKLENDSKVKTLTKVEEINIKNRTFQKWSNLFSFKIREKLEQNPDSLHLREEDLRSTNKDCGTELDKTENNSYGSFLQFFYDKSNLLVGVLNGSFPGYGKMISRFLHIFHDSVTHEMRKWNSTLANDFYILIEDCDSSYFNANIHPPLLPYEIWMPGSHNSLPAKNQLPITEFVVSMNNSSDELQLIHKPTNRIAYVFDLGFQGPKGRSQLFLLLQQFTRAEYLHVNALLEIVNSSVLGKPINKSISQIVKYPRVIYEKQIILQRRSWFIPKAQLPVSKEAESDWEFFIRINAWRKNHEIPDEVFVVINTFIDNYESKKRNKLGKDDYKPQYINFTNPLLVLLFKKIFRKVSNLLKIVEMMPNSSEMLKVDNERFVTEFMVQWYTN